jgi:tetratricopeptide (TPR) repeat protein
MLDAVAIQVHRFQRLSGTKPRARGLRGWPLLLLAVVLAPGSLSAAPAPPPEPDLLTRARLLYNQQQYEGAIELALKARSLPNLASSAALILARAHLERFRQSPNPEDLTAARAALGELRPDTLPPRDRVELLIGLGESLYLDAEFGAAAELFEGALVRSDQLGPAARERLLDWWASALDRRAQSQPVESRGPLYGRILDRMESELRWDSASATAAYWVVAAARGTGDLDRAWDLAIAGWVRTSYVHDGGATLRLDLNRLVLEGIVPERVRERASSEADRERVTASMESTWAMVKQQWSPKEPPPAASPAGKSGPKPAAVAPPPPA